MEHNRGVGGICAGGDGSNHNTTVLELVLSAIKSEFADSRALVLSDVEALEADLVLQAVSEVLLHLGKRHVVVGALGAREAGDHS